MIYSEHIYLGNFLKQTSISLSFPDINTIQTSPLSVTSQIPRACITIFHQVLRSRMPLKKHWNALAPHGHNHVFNGIVPHTEELLTNGQWCPPKKQHWKMAKDSGHLQRKGTWHKSSSILTWTLSLPKFPTNACTRRHSKALCGSEPFLSCLRWDTMNTLMAPLSFCSICSQLWWWNFLEADFPDHQVRSWVMGPLGKCVLACNPSSQRTPNIYFRARKASFHLPSKLPGRRSSNGRIFSIFLILSSSYWSFQGWLGWSRGSGSHNSICLPYVKTLVLSLASPGPWSTIKCSVLPEILGMTPIKNEDERKNMISIPIKEIQTNPLTHGSFEKYGAQG